MRARSVCALGVLAALVACNGTKLKKADLESAILKDSRTKRVPITGVECPPDRAFSQGDTFECKGEGDDGDTVTFTVTQENGSGQVSWKLNGGIYNPSKLGDSIEKSVGEKVDIQCPDKPVIMRKGKSIVCDAVIGGEKRHVKVTLTDDEGHVSASMVD